MPGTSGLLSPFSNIDGLYFDNSDEPDDFAYQLAKDLEKKYEGQNIEYVKLDFESKDDFYNALMSMKKFTEDNVSVLGTSREGHYEIVVEADKELDVTDDTASKE